MVTVLGLELALVVLLGGLLLIGLEALAPGAHFIVLGVALTGAGAIGLAVPALGSPLALAGLTLLFGSIALVVYREVDIYGGKGREQTSDHRSLLGREGFVTQRVTRSQGEVKLDSGGFDPHYRSRTPAGEIPVGTRVVVVDPGGGNLLTVEPVEETAEE
ncbi:MAG: NfeD family protein [Halobacteriales archaeon]